ncbi:MAG: tetratricopeptide repeat protein [Bernardetiaceae bacterium]|nr:tetratricopeptide repeat protein [Bernardetiaceae bacterium]
MNKIEGLERLLSQGHDNAILRFGLGQSYLTAEQPGPAAEHFERAVAHDPDYSAAWKGLGQSLTQLDRPEEAVEAYEAGIAAAKRKGDAQAGREMEVFLKRLLKKLNADSSR